MAPRTLALRSAGSTEHFGLIVQNGQMLYADGEGGAGVTPNLTAEPVRSLGQRKAQLAS
jgi:hypothetical protein